MYGTSPIGAAVAPISQQPKGDQMNQTMKLPLAIVAAIVCVGVFAVYTARAADDATTKVTGVLIDQHCADNMMKKDDPEKAAEAHKKSCCIKCAEHGYAVISGKKEYKFDDKGNQLAKDYLAKDDSKTAV